MRPGPGWRRLSPHRPVGNYHIHDPLFVLKIGVAILDPKGNVVFHPLEKRILTESLLRA
jgi:hypothetical protein